MKRQLPYLLALAMTTAVTIYLATRPMDPEEAVRQVLAADHRDGGAAGRCRRAVDDLVAVGPDALPFTVAAMPEVEVMDDLIRADWLRCASDRIVDDAARSGEPIPVDELVRIAGDRSLSGNARREALKIVRQVRPDAIDPSRHRWLDDPVFDADALRKQALARDQLGDRPKGRE